MFKLWHFILMLALSFLGVQWIFIPTSEANAAQLADLDVLRCVMRIFALFVTSFIMLMLEWGVWVGERERDKRMNYQQRIYEANLYQI